MGTLTINGLTYIRAHRLLKTVKYWDTYHYYKTAWLTLTWHIETNPLICRANHWTGFYIIGTSVKELKMRVLQVLLFEVAESYSETIYLIQQC